MALSEEEELELMEMELALAGESPEQSVPEQPEPETLFGLPEGVSKSLFPQSTAHAQKYGEGSDAPLMSAAGAVYSDVTDIPKRAFATLRGQEMSDPEAGIFKPEADALVEKIRHKEPQPTYQARDRSGRMRTVDPNITRERTIAAIETVEDIVSDPGIIFGAAKAGVKLLGKGAEEAIKDIVSGRLLDKLAGQAAQEIGQVPEKALRQYATKKGKKLLKESFGKEAEIGEGFAKELFAKLPEGKKIAKILKEVKDPLDLSPAKNLLKRKRDELSKGIGPGKALSEEEAAARALLDKQIQYLDNIGAEKLPAEQYKQVRENLDAAVDWSNPVMVRAHSKVQDALKRSRRLMAKQMEFFSGKVDPKYAEEMKNWHEKLTTMERLRRKVGDTVEKARTRVEGTIRRVEGASTPEALRKDLRDFDAQRGTNFAEQAEAASQAKKLSVPDREELTLPLLPKGGTGNRLVALIAPMLGSPRLAVPTLQLTAKTASAGEALLPILNKYIKGAAITRASLEAGEVMGLIESLSDGDKEKLSRVILSYDKNPSASKKKMEDIFEKGVK